MTARRASGVMRDQAPISSMDRKHPVQSRACGCTTQILMQGLSISSRFQTVSLISFPLLLGPKHAQAVQHTLEDIAGRYVVDNLRAPFSGCVRLQKGTFGGDG